MEGLQCTGKQSSPHAALLTAILGACAKANSVWRPSTRAPAVASPPAVFSLARAPAEPWARWGDRCINTDVAGWKSQASKPFWLGTGRLERK